MANNCIANGYLYKDNKIQELIVHNGSEIKIQGIGNTKGTYKLLGKLTEDSDYVPITVIGLNGMVTKDSVTDNGIYTADINGLYSISVSNCTKFTKIYATVYN